MRVLVVNAYKDNLEGKKAFQNFYQAIQKAFQKQKYFNKEDIKFTCVDYKTIDSYLYEQHTQYVDIAAEKKFDYLDFVFIDGEANLLPWQSRAFKFLVLLRMCKRTGKVLFAGGCGMLMQVYLCANKYHVNRVINGKGKGTDLKKIYEISREQLAQIDPGDVFLDSGTGDMYCYDMGASEFIPIVNIGFHNKKVAEDMENKQSILKPNKYQPRTSDFSEPIIPVKHSETVCRIIKQCMHHWLFKDLNQHDFLVSQKNSWDIHAINIGDMSSRFSILAESSRSPQVIHMHNTVGTLFNIDQNYPHSLKILQNFIDYMLEVYQKLQKLDKPLSSVPYSVIPSKPYFRSQSIISRPITASTAKLDTSFYPGQNMFLTAPKLRPTSSHSGFAISRRKHEPVIVSNNATSQTSILVHPAKVQASESMMVLPLGKALGVKLKGNLDNNFIKNLIKKQLGCTKTSCAQEYMLKKNHDSDRPTTRSNDFSHQNELYKILNSQEPVDETTEMKAWGKNEIRSMLHGIENNISEQRNRKQKIKIVYKSKYCPKRQKSCTDIIGSTLNQKTKSLKYPFPGSVTNCEPYVEPGKALIRPESKPGNWMSSERFSVPAKNLDQKGCVVVINEPYKPSSGHKFRNDDKSKWLRGSFKVI